MWTALLWHTLLPGSAKAIDLISHRPNHQNPQPKARLSSWVAVSVVVTVMENWGTQPHSSHTSIISPVFSSQSAVFPAVTESRQSWFPPLAIYEHWYYYVRSLVLSGLSPAQHWIHTEKNLPSPRFSDCWRRRKAREEIISITVSPIPSKTMALRTHWEHMVKVLVLESSIVLKQEREHPAACHS